MNTNFHFKALSQAAANNGLTLRIATQQNGLARVYLGSDYETFYSNNVAAGKLEEKAKASREDTHLGRALRDLAEQVGCI